MGYDYLHQITGVARTHAYRSRWPETYSIGIISVKQSPAERFEHAAVGG